MHIGAVVVIALIILACQGPAAVMRAVSGLGSLILIAAIALLLLWVVVQIQDRSTTNVQPAPAIAQ